MERVCLLAMQEEVREREREWEGVGGVEGGWSDRERIGEQSILNCDNLTSSDDTCSRLWLSWLWLTTSIAHLSLASTPHSSDEDAGKENLPLLFCFGSNASLYYVLPQKRGFVLSDSKLSSRKHNFDRQQHFDVIHLINKQVELFILHICIAHTTRI